MSNDEIQITLHARKRMAEYDIDRDMITAALDNPDQIVEGKKGRLIAHSGLNGKILRVVYEQGETIKTVVTTYRAEADRYEV